MANQNETILVAALRTTWSGRWKETAMKRMNREREGQIQIDKRKPNIDMRKVFGWGEQFCSRPEAAATVTDEKEEQENRSCWSISTDEHHSAQHIPFVHLNFESLLHLHLFWRPLFISSRSVFCSCVSLLSISLIFHSCSTSIDFTLSFQTPIRFSFSVCPIHQ